MKGHRLTWVLSAACLACASFLAGWALPKSATSAVDAVAANQRELPTSNTPTPEASGSTRSRFVGFAKIHGIVGQQPQVPVIAGPDVDYEELLREPIQVPNEMRRQYRNEGLAIQATRRVMAFEFEGQRFAIPLDQFGVRYVGNEVL